MKSIVFDLDDTICFPNHGESDSFEKYGKAKPNEPIINEMKKLKEDGFKIIISSSRRMLTHNNNVAAVIKDIGEITQNWLEKHEVPYDHLQFGKPYASTLYVDDKAITPETFLLRMRKYRKGFKDVL